MWGQNKKVVELTLKQFEVYESLKRAAPGFLRRHTTPTGRPCFRLLDGKYNPISNIQHSFIEDLVSLSVLSIDKVTAAFTLKNID